MARDASISTPSSGSSIAHLRALAAQIPSFVFFADEQHVNKLFVLGGIFIHRRRLLELDLKVAEAKRAVGLSEDAPIKWSPPNTADYHAQRQLPPSRRELLKKHMFAILDALEAICFFSFKWVDPSKATEAYEWTFENVLERLIMTLERQIRAKQTFWYPALDVVVDWIPDKLYRRYFAVYWRAFVKGYTFEKNTLPPLKKLGACPCLLVTSCHFSPALQLSDYCVGSVGTLVRWAYERKQTPDDVVWQITPVAKHFLRSDKGEMVGYGIVTPNHKAAREKIRQALTDLKVI